jgi:hypothetical protein
MVAARAGRRRLATARALLSAGATALAAGAAALAAGACSSGGPSGGDAAVRADGPGMDRAGTDGPASGAGGAGARDGGGAGGGGGAVLTPAEFWSRFADALCHRYAHCLSEPYQSPHLQAMTAADGNLDRCAAGVRAEIVGRPGIAALADAVARGALHVDAAEAQRCLDAVTRCAFPPGTPPRNGLAFEDIVPCRAVFHGDVPLGGPCELDGECAGEAYCGTSASGDTATGCFGVCAARVAAGAACTDGKQCAAPPPPAVAWPACTSGACAVTTVAVPASTGQSCAPQAGAVTPCGDDLYCDMGTRTCLAAGATGAACGTVAACTGGACTPYCLRGSCVSGQCAPLTVRTTAGAACDGTAVLCDAFASLLCTNSSCAATDGSAGSACTLYPWYGATVCDAGLVCNPSGQCNARATQPVGGACVQPDDCASGNCERRTRTCVAKLCSAP